MLPGLEMAACTEMAVPMEVMQHVVRVESSFNRYAIGVVGGRLARQPRNLSEAVSTARMLEREGYNFSLGIAQVNRYNLAKQGLGSYERAFEVCPNLQAGARILAECHGRAGGDWGKAFSCYYSGNFSTGFRHGYVQKVFASWQQTTGAPTDAGAIPLVAGTRSLGRQPAAGTTALVESLVARRIRDATRSEPGADPIAEAAQPDTQRQAQAAQALPGSAPLQMQPGPEPQHPAQPGAGPAVAARAQPVRLQPNGAPPVMEHAVQPGMAVAMPASPQALAYAQPPVAAQGNAQAVGASPPTATGKDEAFVF